MNDNLEIFDGIMDRLDTKSTMEEFMTAFETALSLLESIKTTNAEERQQIQTNVENALTVAVEKAQNRLLKTSQLEWVSVRDRIEQAIALIRDGKDGESIAGPVGPAGPAGESIKGDKGDPGQDAPDLSPDEVTNRLNQGTPLIKKERIEGLADIERIAKTNAFNPTMGPSFSDLRDIRQTISDLSVTTKKVTINYIIDGGGSAITTGVKGFVEIPYAMTITGWQIFADQVGSIVIDVWKDSYTNFPPTGSDTITGSQKPTLSSAQSNQNLSLSTWTTTAVAGDILAFNVDSISTVTRVTVSILGTKN